MLDVGALTLAFLAQLRLHLVEKFLCIFVLFLYFSLFFLVPFDFILGVDLKVNELALNLATFLLFILQQFLHFIPQCFFPLKLLFQLVYLPLLFFDLILDVLRLVSHKLIDFYRHSIDASDIFTNFATIIVLSSRIVYHIRSIQTCILLFFFLSGLLLCFAG